MTDSTVWVRLGAALDRSPDAHRVELNRETAEAMLAEHATLRADNARLRAALEGLVCNCKSNCAWERDEVCPDWAARAALKGASYD